MPWQAVISRLKSPEAPMRSYWILDYVRDKGFEDFDRSDLVDQDALYRGKGSFVRGGVTMLFNILKRRGK
jgi:hypothetical protein